MGEMLIDIGQVLSCRASLRVSHVWRIVRDPKSHMRPNLIISDTSQSLDWPPLIGSPLSAGKTAGARSVFSYTKLVNRITGWINLLGQVS
jgi:hypothetical protein